MQNQTSKSVSGTVRRDRQRVVEFHAAGMVFGGKGRGKETVACADLNLFVHGGEILVMVGETGCGKSTTLSMLLGTAKPTSGTVEVLGLDPYDKFRDLAGKISIIFQSDRLLPWRTALDNAALGLEILRVPKAERHAVAREWLARVGLEHAIHKYPHELSGGMRQRTAIARAFAVDPEIVVADEAFSALDEMTGARIRADLIDLIEVTGKTAIFVTHSISEAVEIGHRIVVMAPPGRIVEEIDVSSEDGATPNTSAVEGKVRSILRGAQSAA